LPAVVFKSIFTNPTLYGTRHRRSASQTFGR